MVIFLSNFLALLIKVDAAGEGNRQVLGGILVAINVLLFAAVVLATWLATHQAVVETREGDEALGVARAVLTFEKRAAASARFTRQQTSAPLSSSPMGSGFRMDGDDAPEGDRDRAAASGASAADDRPAGDRAESVTAVDREAFSESHKDQA